MLRNEKERCLRFKNKFWRKIFGVCKIYNAHLNIIRYENERKNNYEGTRSTPPRLNRNQPLEEKSLYRETFTPENIETNNIIGQLQHNINELKSERERLIQSLNQKASFMKTAVKNFIISSGKLNKYIQKRGGAEIEFAFKIYDNDKKVLEDYLEGLVS